MSIKNVLLVMTDQQHFDSISALGNPYINTPGFDRLVKEGITFTNNYTPYPICGPARAAILTGRMPSECGVYTNGLNATKKTPHIGQWFTSIGGRQMIYSGKWHVRMPHTAEIPGFDVINSGINCQGVAADSSITMACEAWLRNYTGDKPFIMTAQYTQPHDICAFTDMLANVKDIPYPIPQDELPPMPDNFTTDDIEPRRISGRKDNHYTKNWNEQQWRYYRWAYLRYVEMVDTEINRLLTVLDDTGLSNNTMILFTSDHGEGLGSHGMTTKNFLYDESAKVPCIIRMPQGENGGLRIDEPVSGLDIFPTICDFLGEDSPKSTGTSLKPLIVGDKVLDRNGIAVECYGGQGQAFIGREGYKLISFNDDDTKQLFNLKTDSGELHNLAKTEIEMRKKYEGYLKDWQNKLVIAPCIPDENRW